MLNYLKKIREDKKMSQSQLARKIGVSKQLLSGFEKGRSGVSNEVLKKLASALEVSSDVILSGKTHKSFDENSRKNMSEAMNLVFENYGDEFDKETIVKISTELYALMIDFESINEDSHKKQFLKSLEEKIAAGLAAQCFLKFKK
jgi:transcriptional regulator with XRE-family HTH domain